MALTKADLATIAELVASMQAPAAPAEPAPTPNKRTLPAQGKAQKSANAVGAKDVNVKDSPVSFRAVVSDYMLKEGQGHRYSARWVAVTHNAETGKETVLKSNTIAVLDALATQGTLGRIRSMIDTANKDAKLGEYAASAPVADEVEA